MALFIIRDLTHWEAWEDLPLIWKHKYYLPVGVNCFVCVTQQVQWVVYCLMVSNKWYLMWHQHCNFFRGFTHEWVPSVFEVFFLVLICGNVFIIKLRRDGCSCRITCRWCMGRWILLNRFIECWVGFFWYIIFVKTPNILDHYVN